MIVMPIALPVAWIAAVIVVFASAALFAWSLCRAAARGDICPSPDVGDVYCPHCDGIDVSDWGDDGWWSCHGCQVMFEVKS